MLQPKLAIVRPRVISPATGEVLLLEDEVQSLIDRRRFGMIRLVGDPGSGKTTALTHLATTLPAGWELQFLKSGGAPASIFQAELKRQQDELGVEAALLLAEGDVNWYSSAREVPVYRLAPWGIDEVLEYLLAVHPAHCESVMRRCSSPAEQRTLCGNAELWREVLDLFAADPELPNLRAALSRLIDLRLPEGSSRAALASAHLLEIARSDERKSGFDVLFESGSDSPRWRILQSPVIRSLLAAEHLVATLREGDLLDVLRHKLPCELIREAGAQIAEDGAILSKLRELLKSKHQAAHPNAASLLHATGTGWRPKRKVVFKNWTGILPGKQLVPNLHSAFLAGANWRGSKLAQLQMCNVDLSGSDLSESKLDGADLKFANLQGAQLIGSRVNDTDFSQANLSGADLSRCRGTVARFLATNARGTRFEEAELHGALFYGADLTQARFVAAALCGSDLTSANVEDAEFDHVDFTDAILCHLMLRVAKVRTSRFARVNLRSADLEEMSLPGADFSRARLDRALLTGTFMPGADFRLASLTNTGLAEIEWERADLRQADLRGASFHMGSSRSGLVHSTIASYGSRTGFYTDDYYDQDFKAPEEIRKANLRGADLRGANIEGVDFYLVDLRDALYDESQARQLRGTGAILESRVH